MRYILFNISILVLGSLGACTSEPGELLEEGGTLAGTRLVVQTSSLTNEDDYEPFNIDDAIYVYYGYKDLDNSYPWHQGKYICKENKKDASWTPDTNESIYIEDIKSPNLGKEYWFTAVTLPQPKVSSDFYGVESDQTKDGYLKSDFKVARAVYGEAWDKSTIAFHFRHVLSRLRVQLILPKGKEADGFFENPMVLTVIPSIVDKTLEYDVTFDNSIGDRGILVTTLNENATSQNIEMHSDGTPEECKIDVGINKGLPAAKHTFSSILPVQSIPQGDVLLEVKIGGKTYKYIPPTANTVTLGQEEVTTIILTLLSGPGETKLELFDVKKTKWKHDSADVGDLLLQNK